MDIQALSFYIDDVKRQKDRSSEHGELNSIFRHHQLQFVISGTQWTPFLQYYHRYSTLSKSHLSRYHFPPHLSTIVDIKHPDQNLFKPLGTTDVVIGEDDPQFTNRFTLPAFSMHDSQYVARKTILRFRARFSGVELGRFYIDVATLVWQLVAKKPLDISAFMKAYVPDAGVKCKSKAKRLLRSVASSSSSLDVFPVPIISVKVIRGRRTHISAIDGSNTPIPIPTLIEDKEQENGKSNNEKHGKVNGRRSEMKKEQTIEMTVGISHGIIPSLPPTGPVTPIGFLRVALVSACEKPGEWSMTQHARTRPTLSTTLFANLPSNPSITNSSVSLSSSSYPISNPTSPSTIPVVREVAQLMSGRWYLFGSGENFNNKVDDDDGKQVRLQAAYITEGTTNVLGFCQFRLSELATKRWLQWHVRGKKNISGIVAVRSFSMTPSIIQVTLEIGADLEFTRGGPVGIQPVTEELANESQEDNVSINKIEQESKSEGNICLKKSSSKGPPLSRAGSSSLWNKLSKLRSGSKGGEKKVDEMAEGDIKRNDKDGNKENIDPRENEGKKRDKWRKKVVPVYSVRFPGQNESNSAVQSPNQVEPNYVVRFPGQDKQVHQ